MATSLSAQLAQIAASSTNQLDLKAQRKAHSQSLIFEKDVAVSQDFDTIYQICVEGFQELCLLDPKLTEFARNVFSEQSKREERSQMTAVQNQELDRVLEKCLCLLGAHLMLRPTVKAFEWLVRRFRVHENNTTCLVLTLLPYHTLPLFATFLSILPKTLPQTFKFLHPYVESLATPPRHTILYAATNNVSFLSAWNEYVLRCSRGGYHHRSMIQYWATIVAEAIGGQIGQTTTGGRKAQRHKEEDVLIRVLPILNEGLALKKVDGLRIGCCLIVTVIASKASLEDRVQIALMEAVMLGHATETTQAELLCLAVLAQRREKTKLPKSVSKAIMALDDVAGQIVTLSKTYTVNKLVFGLVHRALQGLRKNIHLIKFIEITIENELLSESHSSAIIATIISTINDTNLSDAKDADARKHLVDLISKLAVSMRVGKTVQRAIRECKIETQQIKSSLQPILKLLKERDPEARDIEMSAARDLFSESEGPRTDVTFQSVKRQIPEKSSLASFLSHSEPEPSLYGILARAFILSLHSDLEEFVDLPVFRDSLVDRESFFITFFARFWCGTSPASARAAALCCLRDHLRRSNTISDIQLLLPYVLYALCDRSFAVREAAVDFTLVFKTLCIHGKDTNRSGSILPIQGDSLDNQSQPTQDISWLSPHDLESFFGKILVPNLEECRLDSQYIIGLLQTKLNGSKHSNNPDASSKDLRTHFRVAVFSFLSSNCINTPLYAVKLKLLEVINGVDKVGSISRAKLMMPLLIFHEYQTEEQLNKICEDNKIDKTFLLSQLVQIVSPKDREGIKVLHRIIASAQSSPLTSIRTAALQRIKTTWTLMKHDMQLLSAIVLFPIACDAFSKGSDSVFESDVIEALRSVPLSADALLTFLTKASLSVTEVDEQSPASKRRKTDRGHVDGKDSHDENPLSTTIKQITMVLELVEGSEDGDNPRLLLSLFDLLAEMRQAGAKVGTDLGYSLTLVLKCLRSVVDNAKASVTLQLERSHVRADLVIDCFKATSNPQVQNAALLLLSSLAKVVPDAIIHSVMPVFTFMGATTLRQLDEHSVHVIDQTIESVIPPLIISLRKQKGGALAGTIELFLSFVAAFEHIPAHRRIALFATLVDKVGPEDHLFALFVSIVETHRIDEAIFDFAVGLSNRYEPIVQLRTVEKCLEVVADAFSPNPSASSRLFFSEQEAGRTEEDGTERDDDKKDRANIIRDLLTLSSRFLKNPRLSSKISKLLNVDDAEAERGRAVYSRLTEQVLQLKADTQSSREFSILYNELFGSLFHLITLNEHLRSLDASLAHSDDDIRLRILKIFKQRLDSTTIEDGVSREACLNFIPKLMSILNGSTNVPLRQTVLACCDRIAEKYGKTSPDAMMGLANVISESNCLGASEPQLRSMSLLCLTTLIGVMGEEMLPVIPRVLSTSLRDLDDAIAQSSPSYDIQSAAYSLFSSIFLHIPWVMTGDSLDQFLTAVHRSAASEHSTPCDQGRRDALDLLAKQSDPQECFAALTRTWNSAVVGGPKAVEEYLTVVLTAIGRHSKSIIKSRSQQLLSLFLQVMDLRRSQQSHHTQNKFTEDRTQSIEQKSHSAIMDMVFKLNDTHFRPLFVQMSEWAAAVPKKEGRLFRKISWYSFLQAFFGSLKAVVISYAGFIVDDVSEVLKSFEPSDTESVKLWECVVGTLSVAFENDQQEFWQSPSRFETVAEPLLAQFSNVNSVQATSTLIPCIIALATAANSPDHHKTINTAIMTRMRSESASIRRSAVQCEIGLTENLGEEWLSLLHEMLPFISEAMEDDDEEVETEVRRWVRIIEGIMGESLDAMLQ